MMLTEIAAVPVEALPVQAAKDHLRMGTGFADDSMQDGLVAAYLRAAIAAIEGRTGKALLSRAFLLKVDRLNQTKMAQTLPLAPVAVVNSVKVIDRDGAEVLLDPQKWRLVQDLSRPSVKFVGGVPCLPEAGHLEIVFSAGFGATWSGVPPDLAQAVLLLTGEFYERRHSGGEERQALPQPVQALIERWRTVRVLGGGGV